MQHLLPTGVRCYSARWTPNTVNSQQFKTDRNPSVGLTQPAIAGCLFFYPFIIITSMLLYHALLRCNASFEQDCVLLRRVINASCIASY